MGVTSSVLRQVGNVLITLLVVSALVFLALQLVPGDPLDILIQGRGNRDPAAVAAVTEKYGLDQPLWVQFWNWLTNVVTGDFGYSYRFRSPVSELIVSRLPTTIGLVAYSMALIAIVGVAVGVYSAVKAGRTIDRALVIVVTAVAAVPAFVAGVVLISAFSVGLGWFPTFGMGSGFFDAVWHLTLPAIALAIGAIALVARVVRVAMIEQLGKEHVEVALSRGVPFRTVVGRHAFRNSLGPITTILGTLLAALFVGSSVVEQLFGLNGVGSLLVQAINGSDFPVVQAIVLIVVVAFVVTNAIVDSLQPLIDPRSAAGRSAR
ncbi:MAG TPA: ABC transporter permease [Microbacterium sp.]|uniref:ABC transporter permease n=1 Tax=Microbacterium sp. TaxID=51671 RepID=UPI002C9D64E6|nr:ABC transporter permease [Microbacterium sp.]HWI30047.1 ABC transporter permease [Microbacterium sp.]